MIKLVYGNKNKIIKHGSKGFQELREVISSNFPEAPADYSLSYLDEDQDEICLNSEQDLANMLNYNLKVHKVYIKQSLSQTVVLDLERSDLIEPSFEQTQSRVIDSEETGNDMIKFDKPKGQEQKVFEDVPQSEKLLSSSIESYDKQPKVQAPKLEPQNQICITVQRSQPQDGEKAVDPVPEKEMEIYSQYIEIQSQEILVPKQQLKVTFDAAIQSESFDVQVPKVEPIRMEVEPTRILFSDSLDVSAIRKIPTVYEQRMDVTRAKIVSKAEEVRPAPKKQAEIELHEVICSNCKDEFGIIGTRYQCILCEGFNLCSNCQAEVDHKHSLVKVKRPGQAIRKDQLVEKLRDQIYQKHPKISEGYYVPSLNKEDAQRIIEAARESYKLGMERSQKLMEDLFFKMEMNHSNPYEIAKPAPEKVETIYEKAKYLQDLMGVSYQEAQKFAAQYHHLSSQKIVQTYLAKKNL